VLLTVVGSVHDPKIVLGMLVKVLCRDSIATGRRLSREGNVTFEDLMRGASDFDVRAVAVKTLTSLRHLLPISVEIVTVITTIRAAVLSCSHDTFCTDDEIGSLTKQSAQTRSIMERVALLFRKAPALSRRNVRRAARHFQRFLAQVPQKPAS
jgi:hypothetical protein